MSKQPNPMDDVLDQELLGKLLEAVPRQSPPPDLRAKVLARALSPSVLADFSAEHNDSSNRERIATNTPFERYVNQFMTLFDLDAKQARDILKKAEANCPDSFSPCGIPGTQLFYFQGGPRVANATCGVLKMTAGAIFPAHQHRGDERVIVLQGSATEQSGRRFHAGELIHCRKGTRHSFRADTGDTLIFAVALEKPNKWLVGQIVLDYIFKKRRFVRRDE